MRRKRHSRPSTPLLNIILTRLAITPRHHHHVLRIQRRDELVPLRHLHDVAVVFLLGARVEVGLDRVEEVGDGGGEGRDGGGGGGGG